MLKNLEYICFDFETTWVDIKKDEPIQFWLIKFNNKFNIIDKYSSFFNPEKNISELKNIVSYITWISLDELKNQPKFIDKVEDIKKFFTRNSVLIWHNIEFDIWFLNKYTKIEFLTSLDTLELSKSIFHFVPSYSLEILNEILNDKWINYNNINLEKSYHNALYDSYASYKLFRYYIETIISIIEKYQVLWYYISNSNSNLNKIIDTSQYKNKFKKINLYLPPLKKEINTNRKIINDKKYQISNKNYFIWNINFKSLINNIVTWEDKLILSFASRSKLDIAKKILIESWIKNISYLNDDLYFDSEKVNEILNKEIYEDFEVNFLVKYYLQYEKWHSFLDINSWWDHKVINNIKQNYQKKYSNIILSTHNSLYQKIKSNEIPSWYKILYFDHDFWYQTFSKFLNNNLDLYYFLSYLEFLEYKYNYDNNLSNLINTFQIYIWILYIELWKIFRWLKVDKIEINPIIWNIDFFYSNKILFKIFKMIDELENILFSEDFTTLKDKVKNIENMFNDIVYVWKKSYNENEIYYTFNKSQHVSYMLFKDFFWDYKISFFSNYDYKQNELLDNNSKIIKNNYITKTSNIESIKNYIQKNNSIFILSTNKLKSKELFEYIFKNNLNNNKILLVENFTGWLWKNIFYCKRNNTKIVIWWYEFLINLIAENILFDKYIVYFSKGPIEWQILNDIWYFLNYSTNN